MFTVHHITTDAIEPQKDSTAQLLLQGQQILRQATATEGWRNVNGFLNESTRLGLGKTLEYTTPPPGLSERDGSSDLMLRSWASAAISERGMATLRGFDGTNLSHLRRPQKGASRQLPPPAHIASRKRKGPLDEGPATVIKEHEEAASSRKKLKSGGSIYSYIPQPHYLPYPPTATVPKPLVEIERVIKPFSKSILTAISPHSSNSIADVLNQRFARTGWIVPVRGQLPWPTASKALLWSEYDFSSTIPDRDQVNWTEDSLKKFWEFLIGVRSAQALGVISLSFHAAPRKSMEVKHTLLDCDHIKIHCDARMALHIRTVLAAWKFRVLVEKADGRTGEKSTEQIRVFPLKDAKLVLVDHSGKGVLIL